MKVVGLITEYNPFHNGHKYHIEEAKRLTGADYAIAAMSGNFVQRGTPAVIDKYSRTEMALNNGIDLVLELPVCYATGSAEYFAHGAVSLLDRLGIVDYLCFGSECGDLALLEEAAGFLLDPPPSFDETLHAYLKEGFTYPAARGRAMQHLLEDQQPGYSTSLTKLLTEPNNILGIEYMKALRRLDSKIAPRTVQRILAQYHDPDLSKGEAASPAISSATAIRRAIFSKGPEAGNYFGEISHSVPPDVYHILKKYHRVRYPISEEDFSQVIRYKLLYESRQSLAGYLDISEDLADRLKNLSTICSHRAISELAQEIKTKNLTLTRINRAILHMLLNIKAETVQEYNRNGYTQYARVLGIKKESSHLLRKIEKHGRIPIIMKVSKAEQQLPPPALRMLQEDILAAHLYIQAVYEKYGTIIPNEYRHGIILYP
ncbi:MAG TPA: nucleotidyltransferase [Clostridiales bacterium]|nr:nucleotidyltransferase [Clostridiales bacterium]